LKKSPWCNEDSTGQTAAAPLEEFTSSCVRADAITETTRATVPGTDLEQLESQLNLFFFAMLLEGQEENSTSRACRVQGRIARGRALRVRLSGSWWLGEFSQDIGRD